jgi:hypothetical protein
MCDPESTSSESPPEEILEPHPSLPTPHPLPKPSTWRELPVKVIQAYTPLYRIDESKYPSPIHFSKRNANRFSDPREIDNSNKYGVLYAALDYYASFREVVTRQTTYTIFNENLSEFKLSQIYCNRGLNLVDLTGAGLTWIDADARLNSGAYRVCQAWGLEFWQYSNQIDGIYYLSRFDPSHYCVALYSERVIEENDISYHIITENLANLGGLDRLLDYYKYSTEEEPLGSDGDIG